MHGVCTLSHVLQDLLDMGRGNGSLQKRLTYKDKRFVGREHKVVEEHSLSDSPYFNNRLRCGYQLGGHLQNVCSGRGMMVKYPIYPEFTTTDKSL